MRSTERRWQADIGRELSLGYRLFLMRQNLSTETVDRMILALDDPKIISEIVQHGDMDRPGNITGILMKKPALLRFLSPLLVSGIRSLL